MFLGFIQQISLLICKKDRILHSFIVKSDWDQKRIPKQVKNTVIADCHQKCGKIFVFICIEQSCGKNGSRNISSCTFTLFR